MISIQEALAWKHGPSLAGVTIEQHRRVGYASPDAYYEAALLRSIGPGTRWLDVGCGRSPCPANPRLAGHLSRTAALFVGVDPGPNLPDNPYLHRAVAGDVTAVLAESFDVVTMRMVAEHVASPRDTAAALHRLVRPGGRLLIYTVHARSPTALLGRIGPHRLHRAAMRRLFAGEDRDVFRAYYRMNTPARLRALLPGFDLLRLEMLDDCRTTVRFPRLHAAELALWSGLRRVGLRYPERCLLAEFTRRPQSDTMPP